MIYKKLTQKPNYFFAWECISLCIENATVDFAIKNRDQLFALLTVLNDRLNSTKFF